MPYTPQDLRLRNILLGAKKQSAYGTALAIGDLVRRLEFEREGNFAVLGQEYFSDLELAGKGHYFPTVRTPIARDVAFQLSGPLDNFMAGWLAAYVMMASSPAGANPYTHTITFEQSTRVAPVTTMYTEDASAIKTSWKDVALETVRISGSQRGPLSFSAAARGSGSLTEGSLTPPALIVPIYLLGNDTDILIGAPGSAASIKERLRSWEVSISSGLVQHRGPGGGLVATMAKIGAQRATVRLAVAASSSDDLRTLFVNNTLQELQINTNSGATAQLNFKFHNLYFKASMLADGLEQVWELVSDETDVMKGAGLEPLTVTAINAQGSATGGAYLVSA